jgi:hypothetical protein
MVVWLPVAIGKSFCQQLISHLIGYSGAPLPGDENMYLATILSNIL